MPNFTITQDWVGYLQRSYEQIKQSVLSRLAQLAPEITDYSESNILIIIISMFAGIAEHLNLYIDRMAQEAFLGTARKYSSVVRLARQLDYRVKAAVPSMVNLTFTLVDSTTNLPIAAISPVAIPLETEVNTPNQIPFLTDALVNIPLGKTSIDVTATQIEKVVGAVIGVTDGTPNQTILIGDNYREASMQITINGDIYTRVDSFGLALATSKVFLVEVNEDSLAQVVFGDGINGIIPPATFNILGTYELTVGATGNLPPNTITTLPVAIPTGIPDTKIIVTNKLYSTAGKNYEDIDDVRKNAPLSLRTLYRAVTYQDYIDVALLAPGVGNAAVRYCCGECVKIYIGPSSKGIAPNNLLVNVQAYFACKRMLGRCVKVLPAGITRIWIKVIIKTLYGVNEVNALVDLATSLNTHFGYDNSYPNKQINISDIIACIDNTPGLDYVDLLEIWAEPYARQIVGNTNLNWVPVIKPGSVIKNEWKLTYDAGINEFLVFLNGLQLANAQIGILYGDIYGIMEFTINPATYVNQDTWEFTTYPYGQNILIDDNTIPIIDVDLVTNTNYPTGFYSVSLIKGTTAANCNPPC